MTELNKVSSDDSNNSSIVSKYAGKIWQAELTFINFSDIRNNYFRYLKKTILEDIPKHVRILDVQSSYFGHQK